MVVLTGMCYNLYLFLRLLHVVLRVYVKFLCYFKRILICIFTLRSCLQQFGCTAFAIVVLSYVVDAFLFLCSIVLMTFSSLAHHAAVTGLRKWILIGLIVFVPITFCGLIDFRFLDFQVLLNLLMIKVSWLWWLGLSCLVIIFFVVVFIFKLAYFHRFRYILLAFVLIGCQWFICLIDGFVELLFLYFFEICIDQYLIRLIHILIRLLFRLLWLLDDLKILAEADVDLLLIDEAVQAVVALDEARVGGSGHRVRLLIYLPRLFPPRLLFLQIFITLIQWILVSVIIRVLRPAQLLLGQRLIGEQDRVLLRGLFALLLPSRYFFDY